MPRTTTPRPTKRARAPQPPKVALFDSPAAPEAPAREQAAADDALPPFVADGFAMTAEFVDDLIAYAAPVVMDFAWDHAAETPPTEPEQQASSEPTSPAPEQDGGDTTVGPEEVRLGQAVGLLHRLPLEAVLARANAFAEKIAAMTYVDAVRDLQPRMRVSEGRCAPIYFTADEDGGPEHLFAGDAALSAAQAIGLEEVFVVTVPADDVGAVQAFLASQASSTFTTTEDDDLVWRANGYHTDH